ncbi:heterokaryon incompatibility protein-domain-containing protein [Earliella scabrosa]|nr:heterokaryon incompatibility protein-domain-containing protein [Earliella scabrosa]
MWVVKTSTLRLHYFLSPENVPGGYAILSHVWDHDEQSFQQLQEINSRENVSDHDRRKLISRKIRKFCEVAEGEDYKWVWIDTCCIDKTSSAELSEAINSMFHYYTLAHVCYAYLQDVPSQDAFTVPKMLPLGPTPEGPFVASRWHRRGWTLQELIAPRVLYFLSRSWKSLGSRAEHADLLEEITRIPASILRLESDPHDFSIAQRMSWAADRQTTRVEDEAYSLLGIFDISMPTLYGEGRKAFRRLQGEIMKQSPDTTLFAWGFRVPWDTVRIMPAQRAVDTSDGSDSENASIFAVSPADFWGSDVCYAPPVDGLYPKGFDNFGEDSLITFSVTPYGVLARIPVLKIEGLLLADLFWTTRAGHSTDRLYLWLRRFDDPPFTSTRPRYTVRNPRMVVGSKSASGVLPGALRVTWQDVYLTDLMRDLRRTRQMPIYIPMNHMQHSPLRVPEHLVASLAEQLGATKVHLQNETLPWTGDLPLTITLDCRDITRIVKFGFGKCTKSKPTTVTKSSAVSSPEHQLEVPGCLWAHVTWCAELFMFGTYHYHKCPDDHILTWGPSLEKTFVLDHNTQITLGFTQRAHSPTLTLTKIHYHDPYMAARLSRERNWSEP